MDIKLYLKRINYIGELSPTLEVLTKLQKQHLLSVPFENLDIHLKIKIDPGNSYEKIVIRNRGGFCYELNGLFYRLLKRLGYEVKMVSARVFDKVKGYGAEFDHLVIIAKIGNNNYLVDVGFGEFSFHPLKIEMNKEQTDPRGIFRIEEHDRNYLVVKKKNPDGDFIPQYLFSAKERRIEEFYKMCDYHQTSSDSHFTQNRICSLATEEGRISLTGDILKITAGGSITERKLENETEVLNILRDYFKIRNIASDD